MNKEEIRAGLLQGRTLTQEDWSPPETIKAVDELVEEGVAIATPWAYRDNFQCEVRFVRATVESSNQPSDMREP